MAESIEDSIASAAKQQVWLRMILCIIRLMLIALNIQQSGAAKRF